MAPAGAATRAAGGESFCQCATDDLEGEGANRTSGPNGLDLVSAAGRGCLLEHGNIQLRGRLGQRRGGHAVTDADVLTAPDPDTAPDPAPDGACHVDAWPADEGASLWGPDDRSTQ